LKPEIKTPLTYNDAILLALEANRVGGPFEGSSTIERFARALMAVDATSRQQALADARVPSLIACLKEAVASWELADQDADAEPEDGDPLAEWKDVIAKAEANAAGARQVPTIDAKATRVPAAEGA
jgi:hypothetical protein